MSKISYNSFYQAYKKYHVHIGLIKPKCNHIWLQLKEQHNVIHSHRSNFKSWPSSFHEAANALIKTWETKHQSKTLSVFFKPKTNNDAQQKTRNTRKAKKRKLDILDSLKKEHKLYADLNADVNEGVFNDLEEYQLLPEYASFKDIGNSIRFLPLLQRLKLIRNSNICGKISCIESSGFNFELPALFALVTHSKTYHYLRGQCANGWKPLCIIIKASYARICSLRQKYHLGYIGDEYKPLLLLFNILQISQMERLISFKYLNNLENNYKTNGKQKKTIVTQNNIIENIHIIDKEISSLCYLRSASALKRIECLKRQRNGLMESLRKKQSQCRNSRNYYTKKKAEIKDIENEYNIRHSYNIDKRNVRLTKMTVDRKITMLSLKL